MVIAKLEALKDLLMQFEDPGEFLCHTLNGVGMILGDSVDDLNLINETLYPRKPEDAASSGVAP